MEAVNEKAKLLRVIEILSKPQLENAVGKLTSLEDVFVRNVRAALECWEEKSNIDLTDIRWSYSTVCRDVLLRLSSSLTEIQQDEERHPFSDEGRLSETILSVQQEKNVENCLQLFIVLGLLPYMIPNVGIPVSKRTEYPLLLEEASKNQLTYRERYRRLTQTVDALVDCVKNQHLAKFVLRRHLVDLLAALFQICHAPLKKPASPEEETLLKEMLDDRPRYDARLNYVMNISHPSVLIQSLLVLQGPSPSHYKIIRDASPPAPSWLRRLCARLLTERLIKPGGVVDVIDAVIDRDSQTASSDMWQRCDHLARITATPPSGDPAKQAVYFSSLAPQIFSLLTSSNEAQSRHYRYIGAACLRQISDRSKMLAQEHFITPLLNSLEADDTSDDFDKSLDQIHSIFVTSSDPSPELVSLLHAYVERLLRLYGRLFSGILHAKSLLEEVLIRVLKFSPPKVICVSLYQYLSPRQSEEDLVQVLEEDDRKLDAVVHLVQSCGDKDLLSELFLSSMADLSNFQDTDSQSDVRFGLITVKLLAALSQTEGLQESLSQNSSTTLEFIKIILEKSLKSLNDPDKDARLEEETLSLTFAVIAMLMEENLKKEEDRDLAWNLVDPLKYPLEILARNHSNSKIRSGAEDLRVAIATRGFVHIQKSHQSDETSFQEAMRLLDDVLVPVQGHALLTLSKLLERKDPEAIQHREKLLGIFLECLEHEDSYIYLMAIQGLSSLAGTDTEVVLGVLTKELLSLEERDTKPLVEELDGDRTLEPTSGQKVSLASRSPEVRMKVGEALLKVIRLLGPMVHKYKGELLNALLYCTKDDDLFMRASALSNLGEFCGLLGYSLGPIVHELFNCVTCLAFYDPAIEVRRAAVLLITLLLRGLGTDAIQVLEPILKDLYRTLKDIHTTETDQAMKIHCEEALQELAEIVKKFLTPSMSMKKTIYITRPPPS